MHFSKNALATTIASACTLMALTGQPVVAQAEPQLTMQQEEAAHPRIVNAIHESQEALRELHEAPAL